jgi:hypothetical protein
MEHAWRCVLRAEQDLEAAQQRGAPGEIEDRLGVVYTQALADYAQILEAIDNEFSSG